MRLAALLVLSLPVAAFGQIQFDFTTGTGTVGLNSPALGHIVGPSGPAGVTWYVQQIDEYGGEVQLTLNGQQVTAQVTAPVSVYRIYPVGATVGASAVTFTGFSGGPIVNGSPPTPGTPYLGTIGGVPAGTPATWARVRLIPKCFTPFQLTATAGGVRLNSAGYWTPTVNLSNG